MTKPRKDNSLYQNNVLGIKFNLNFNLWDIGLLIILFSIFFAIGWSANQLDLPYPVGETTTISLSPKHLPIYALHSIVRMLIALCFSLLFTFIVAPLAAKNKTAEKFILPAIDILESVPILGYLSITVVLFIQLFPNSLLGAQCAAIFAIFTSQVWNMTLSFYQSLRNVPRELNETAAVFQLNAWRRFWQIEVPYAMPSLIWNTMISMSAGWFFVVASEAISVSNQTLLLPGIGSYITVAIQQANLQAVFMAIFTMLLVIFIYDQLMFRPLVSWMERFQGEREEEYPDQAWFYSVLTKTRFFSKSKFSSMLAIIKDLFLKLPNLFSPFTSWFTSLFTSKSTSKISKAAREESAYQTPLSTKFSVIFLSVGIVIACIFLIKFITETVTFMEIVRVFGLGSITLVKVLILVLLASLLWVPIGVWVGLNPKLRKIVQPMTQFLAAFPINLIYPLIVTLIIYFNLNVEIWTTPLMILGTQWYILFNVIAGASLIPKDLQLIVKNFHLNAWLKWKRLLLPFIFPYYITGAMAAAAGCWNVSIVSEVVSWGDTTLVATGLGSYITEHTRSGDFPRIALGITVMCCYVILINRLLWHRLYRLSDRYGLE